jgi:hypothetical protein
LLQQTETKTQKTQAMKAAKFFLAMSLALMITGMDAVRSDASNPLTGNAGSSTAGKSITYVVNIDPNGSPAGYAFKYYVMITDDRGNVVGSPQPFRIGTWSYEFREAGIVSGSRTAWMVLDPHFISPNAYIFLPSTMAGPFVAGTSYYFTLTPQKTGNSATTKN